MARRSRNQQSDSAGSASPAWLLPVVVLMLVVGLGSNVYLANLYMRVQQLGAGQVDSFCNVNESVHCAAVAASGYASFLGVPVAVYAAEFFALVIALVLLARTGLWRLRHWESLCLWGMLISLPISLLMAYIALFRLGLVCLLCSVTYGVNLLVPLLISLIHRKRLRALLAEGPRSLRDALSAQPVRVGLVAVVVLGVSQLAWVPDLVGKPRAGSSPAGAAGQAAVPSVPVALSGKGHEVGPEGAPVRIEEFSDYECTICSMGHEIMVQLLARFGDKIHFVHRDYPLDQACNRQISRPFHANACKAAIFARCAEKQGMFWPYSAMLFANQRTLGRPDLLRYARKLGLDDNQLLACVGQPQVRRALLDDIERGIRRKINGTPTFFINGKQVVGPRNLQWWEDAVTRLLASPGSVPTN